MDGYRVIQKGDLWKLKELERDWVVNYNKSMNKI